MATVKQVYDENVRGLPPVERLKLATMILEELTESASEVDFSLAWSDEDIHDAMAFSLASSAHSLE